VNAAGAAFPVVAAVDPVVPLWAKAFGMVSQAQSAIAETATKMK